MAAWRASATMAAPVPALLPPSIEIALILLFKSSILGDEVAGGEDAGHVFDFD